MKVEERKCITLLYQGSQQVSTMSDRFSGLKDSISQDKRNKEKLKNEKKKIRNKNNYFQKQKQHAKPKPVKIDFSEENFPSLCDKSEPIQTSQNENYLEKTKKIKEEKEKNLRKVPVGWIILHKGMVTKNLIVSEKPEINPYYNPAMAEKILEDRELYREELNNILGDMSPYWDMSWLDNDIIDDELESDEESEEEEYVEDW